MTNPTFTAIIASFNERDLVPYAIRSVLGQSRSDWKLIVVDDGSTDGTPDVVSEFAEADDRIALIRNRNQGPGPARNAGIDASESPYVCFLDADDMWMPGYLEAMGAALDEDPGAGIACTDAWILHEPTGRFGVATAMEQWHAPESLPREPETMMELLVGRNFIWASTAVRREALDRAGSFDPEIRVAEDLELWLRILASGYAIVRAPGGTLGIRRERPQALTARELEMMEGLQLAMKVVAADERYPLAVRRLSEERGAELERWRRAVSGESRGLRLLLTGYRKLGALRRPFVDRSRWRDDAPAEVRAAFPEIGGR
jgi:Glycosyl transferase family 2